MRPKQFCPVGGRVDWRKPGDEFGWNVEKVQKVHSFCPLEPSLSKLKITASQHWRQWSPVSCRLVPSAVTISAINSHLHTSQQCQHWSLRTHISLGRRPWDNHMGACISLKVLVLISSYLCASVQPTLSLIFQIWYFFESGKFCVTQVISVIIPQKPAGISYTQFLPKVHQILCLFFQMGAM